MVEIKTGKDIWHAIHGTTGHREDKSLDYWLRSEWVSLGGLRKELLQEKKAIRPNANLVLSPYEMGKLISIKWVLSLLDEKNEGKK